jgi:hypothetical protein
MQPDGCAEVEHRVHKEALSAEAEEGLKKRWFEGSIEASLRGDKLSAATRSLSLRGGEQLGSL